MVARYKRARGYNVLHPIGWDAFGLPAENAAFERKVHPADWTYRNIELMRTELKSMGLSIDWTREFATCDPEYYEQQQLSAPARPCRRPPHRPRSRPARGYGLQNRVWEQRRAVRQDAGLALRGVAR